VVDLEILKEGFPFAHVVKNQKEREGHNLSSNAVIVVLNQKDEVPPVEKS